MNNSLTLVGRIGQEPKVLTFEDTENKLVKLSLGVKEFSANKEDATMWIDVDAWNGLGERVLKLVKKGDEVVVCGRLALSTYTRKEDGATVVKPFVKMTSFHLCTGHKNKEEAASEETPPAESVEKKRGRKMAVVNG